MAADLLIPTWVAPARQQVVDCARIAEATRTEHDRIAGAAIALAWVLGRGPAPVSTAGPDPAQPAAQAELMLAAAVADRGPLPPAPLLAQISPPARFLLEPPPGPQFARGAETALGWVLGVHPGPPVGIPRRLPDGTIPTAQQLLAEAQAARPHAEWQAPEVYRPALEQAQRDARRYRALAELAAG